MSPKLAVIYFCFFNGQNLINKISSSCLFKCQDSILFNFHSKYPVHNKRNIGLMKKTIYPRMILKCQIKPRNTEKCNTQKIKLSTDFNQTNIFIQNKLACRRTITFAIFSLYFLISSSV